MNAEKAAEQALEKEMHRQVDLNYAAFAIALYTEWGWGTKRIANIMHRTERAWDKCGETNERSMIQMLDEDAGIEIRTESGKSWRDLAFLNAKIDVGRLSRPQYIIMRQHQKEWVGAQVVACYMYALHRHDGWGATRAVRLLDQANEIKIQYKQDPKKIKAACLQITGIKIRGEYE